MLLCFPIVKYLAVLFLISNCKMFLYKNSNKMLRYKKERKITRNP